MGNALTRTGGQDKNMYVQTLSGSITYAVGSTWNPVQGANGSGQYAASGAGSTRDALSTDAAGLNYAVVPAGAVLRLAENP